VQATSLVKPYLVKGRSATGDGKVLASEWLDRLEELTLERGLSGSPFGTPIAREKRETVPLSGNGRLV
jgi:hypothetical protein